MNYFGLCQVHICSCYISIAVFLLPSDKLLVNQLHMMQQTEHRKCGKSQPMWPSKHSRIKKHNVNNALQTLKKKENITKHDKIV